MGTSLVLFLCKKHGNISENAKFNLFIYLFILQLSFLPIGYLGQKKRKKKRKREEVVASVNTPREGQS
jgi:hypothetical protein